MDWWKAAGVLLCFIGFCCFYYFAFLRTILGGSVFNYFWLAVGLFCVGLGLVFWFAKGGLSRLPKWLLFIIEAVVGIGCLIFILIEVLIISFGNQTAGEGDYAIILGAKVNGTRPSLSLKARLDVAVTYLNQYPDCKVIVSGGQGVDEGISEAQCMSEYLMEHGILAERILLEDQSTNTQENLEFSKKFCDIENDRIVIISNDFHIFRSGLIAKKMGYQKVSGQSAPSLWYLIPTNYVREFIAVVKDFVFGNI